MSFHRVLHPLRICNLGADEVALILWRLFISLSPFVLWGFTVLSGGPQKPTFLNIHLTERMTDEVNCYGVCCKCLTKMKIVY